MEIWVSTKRHKHSHVSLSEWIIFGIWCSLVETFRHKIEEEEYSTTVESRNENTRAIFENKWDI